MLFVYVTLLSTGPAWLFTFFAIWASLVPDILVAVWEAYSAGDGVLVNKVRIFNYELYKGAVYLLYKTRLERLHFCIFYSSMVTNSLNQ